MKIYPQIITVVFLLPWMALATSQTFSVDLDEFDQLTGQLPLCQIPNTVSWCVGASTSNCSQWDEDYFPVTSPADLFTVNGTGYLCWRDTSGDGNDFASMCGADYTLNQSSSCDFNAEPVRLDIGVWGSLPTELDQFESSGGAYDGVRVVGQCSTTGAEFTLGEIRGTNAEIDVGVTILESVDGSQPYIYQGDPLDSVQTQIFTFTVDASPHCTQPDEGLKLIVKGRTSGSDEYLALKFMSLTCDDGVTPTPSPQPPSLSPSMSRTSSPSASRTSSISISVSSTLSISISSTPSISISSAPSISISSTPSISISSTPSISISSTPSISISSTPSISISSTPSISISSTPSISISSTPSVSISSTPSISISSTPSISISSTSSISISGSASISASNTSSNSASHTASVSISGTASVSISATHSISISGSTSISASQTSSQTRSVSASNTPSWSISGTNSPSLSGSPSSSISGTASITRAPSKSVSSSNSVSVSNTASNTGSNTLSATSSLMRTVSVTSTETISQTSSMSASTSTIALFTPTLSLTRSKSVSELVGVSSSVNASTKTTIFSITSSKSMTTSHTSSKTTTVSSTTSKSTTMSMDISDTPSLSTSVPPNNTPTSRASRILVPPIGASNSKIPQPPTVILATPLRIEITSTPTVSNPDIFLVDSGVALVEFSSTDSTDNIIQVTNEPTNNLNGVPLNDADRRSTVVEILLVSTKTGLSVQPQRSLEICIRTDDGDNDEVCLSSYSPQSGKWECDDYCLSSRDTDDQSLLCGEVDHLTNFALFFVGGEKVKQECEDTVYDSDAYILKDATEDLILVSCVGLFALLVVLMGWLVICMRGEWKKRLRLRDMSRVVVVYNSDT